MKKFLIEIILTILFVFGSTFFVYGFLRGFPSFWNAQFFWSVVLAFGWIVVAGGYYHQGWIVHKGHSADHVSIVLPLAVFAVQCVLFIKGIYYKDWSLIWGAVMVNSGVLFSLYQIFKTRGILKHRLIIFKK